MSSCDLVSGTTFNEQIFMLSLSSWTGSDLPNVEKPG